MEESKKILRNRRKEFKAIKNMYSQVGDWDVDKLILLEYLIFRDFLKSSPKTISRTLKELESFTDLTPFTDAIDGRKEQRERLKRLVIPYELKDWFPHPKVNNKMVVTFKNLKINKPDKIELNTNGDLQDMLRLMRELNEKIKTTTNNKAISSYKRDIFLIESILNKIIDTESKEVFENPPPDAVMVSTELGRIMKVGDSYYLEQMSDFKEDEE